MAPATHMTDVDADALAHCTSFLSFQDVSNMAMTCKYLHKVASSDSVWRRLYSKSWPELASPASSGGAMEAYARRHADSWQFKFSDPVVADFLTDLPLVDHILVNKKQMIFNKGSTIKAIDIDGWLRGNDSVITLSDHSKRITCMRLISLRDTYLYQFDEQSEEDVLVTSSADHTIRLWWKGSCQRCLTSHKGPVTALCDKLLGDGTGKVLASGGGDGIVHLWSLGSRRRSPRASKANFYGPIKMLSVAGNKSSILLSVTGDSKVRLWDVAANSAATSSSCMRAISVPGTFINMKCHEHLLYLATDSSVSVIDLRTMQKALSYSTDEKLCSFDAIPSKSLFCVGNKAGRAMLYDTRKAKACNSNAEPITELHGGHTNPLTHLHMDSYKIVTGARGWRLERDTRVNVWESNTGAFIKSLTCNPTDTSMDAVAVKGHQIVTFSTTNDYRHRVLRYRDFSKGSCPI